MYVEDAPRAGAGLRPVRYKSCARCGEVGHTSEGCPNRVPSAKAMRRAIEERIERAVAGAPSCWERDEYGLFMPSAAPVIRERRSWADGPFCLNCGEFGHVRADCEKPKVEQFEKVVLKRRKK